MSINFRSLFESKSEKPYTRTSTNPQQHSKSVMLSKKQTKKQQSKNIDQMSEMKGILKSALNILKKRGQDIKQFEENIKSKNFVRGRNFEGKVDSKNQPIGLAIYFSKKQHKQYNQYLMFFGTKDSKTNQRTGKGIQLSVIAQKKQNSQQSLLSQLVIWMKILYLYEWSHNIGQIGYYLHRKQQIQTQFKGQFQKQKFRKGIYKVYRNQLVKIIYQGTFSNNKFDGHGKITIRGKSQYVGQFANNKREGFGEQVDILNKTKYIGEFQNDKKNGYGVITFNRKGSMKLKGFWCDNFMKPKQGLYINQKGQVIQIFHEDDQ